MSVRWNYVVGRKLDTYHNHFPSLRRIAQQDGGLASLWDVWIVLPYQRTGRDGGYPHGILRQCRPRQCGQGCKDQKLFHEVPPWSSESCCAGRVRDPSDRPHPAPSHTTRYTVVASGSIALEWSLREKHTLRLGSLSVRSGPRQVHSGGRGSRLGFAL